MTLAIVLAASAVAVAAVKFDGGPGTGAPPSKLDGVAMQKFAKDSRDLVGVSSVSGPSGDVTFSRQASHRRVGPRRGWGTWSHHYRGDVYFVYASSVTLHLPAKTKAFYFYAEPNTQARFTITASSAGKSSGAVPVHGKAGAKFFGFVARGRGTLSSIRVSTSDHPRKVRNPATGKLMNAGGFAIGEFGIHQRH
jgi:hypothetical protein